MITKLPIPNVPKMQDPSAQKWAGDTTRILETLWRTLPDNVQLQIVAYSETGNLRGVEGVPIIVPDHPSGYSVIIWDGTVFQRFTAAGVL
jgi:hypothetical protein